MLKSSRLAPAATTTSKLRVMSTDDNEYSIGEVAALLKVTTRTLRHWDGIGLLSPQWRTVGTTDSIRRMTCSAAWTL